MCGKNALSNSGSEDIPDLNKYRAYRTKNKRSEEAPKVQDQPSNTEKAFSSRIPNGRLIVERFNDGTRRTSITGDYLRDPVMAMSDVTGLMTLANELWKKQKRQT